MPPRRIPTRTAQRRGAAPQLVDALSAQAVLGRRGLPAGRQLPAGGRDLLAALGELYPTQLTPLRRPAVGGLELRDRSVNLPGAVREGVDRLLADPVDLEVAALLAGSRLDREPRRTQPRGELGAVDGSQLPWMAALGDRPRRHRVDRPVLTQHPGDDHMIMQLGVSQPILPVNPPRHRMAIGRGQHIRRRHELAGAPTRPRTRGGHPLTQVGHRAGHRSVLSGLDRLPRLRPTDRPRHAHTLGG